MNEGFWKSYRDELIATGLVLGLSVVGTFFIAGRLQTPQDQEEKAPKTSKSSEVKETEAVLGQTIQEAIEEAVDDSPPPTIAPLPTPTPTISPLDAEVSYGVGGSYKFEDYEVEIKGPKLVFNTQTSESRTFVTEVVIRNKTIKEGLLNRLTVAVIKDGNVIVPKAAMSVTESRRIYPKEQLTFQARLSLIEGTDVKTIDYKPEYSPNPISHDLQTGGL